MTASPTAPEPSEELREKVLAALWSKEPGERIPLDIINRQADDLMQLFAAALAKQDTQSRIAELQYILDNASGGGSWRRIIISRLSELGAERKNV